MTISAPLPANEEERLEALNRYGIWDTPPEEALDELTRLAAQIAGVPVALISFVSRDQQFFKSRLGVEPAFSPRYPSFCAHAILDSQVMVVPDVLLDDRFAQAHLSVHDRPIRFYAGAPLVTKDRFAIGTLCVMDFAPKKLPPEQIEALRILAHQVMNHLELKVNLRILADTANDYHGAMQALEESEAFYHSLVESLPQHIIRKNREGHFTFANQRFCQMLSLPPAAVLGKTDADFFPAEMAAKFRRDDQAVMTTGQPLDIIEPNQTPDGQKRYVHVIKTPICDAFGEISGIQGIFWDVTERRQIEEALAYERDLLQALLANTPDLIYFKDVNSRFLRCSQSLAAWLGVPSAQEVIGKTDADFYPGPLTKQLLEEEQRLLLTGKPLVDQLQQVPDVHGEIHTMLTNKVPLYGANGALRGLIGISTDVTTLLKTEQALRVTEEKYRTIFERAVEGIFQTTPDGSYLDANPSLARIYGYGGTEELMKALTDIEHQLYVNPHRREEFVRLMREKGTVSGFESEVYRRDGSTIWISENARAVFDENGQVQYYEGTVEEITARKQADLERERARQSALESARLKSQFLANVSHEIRTPMNGIIGVAGLLSDTALTDEQRDYLETIRTSAKALLDIINDLLDFSKIEAGKLALEKIPFNIRDTVESTIEVLAERAQVKGLDLVSWVNCDLPPKLLGDAGRVRQILMNLAGNAIKFTERGEVLVHVSKVQANERRVRLRFEIRDTGIGILPEACKKIFQSFVQADGTSTRRYEGTGLGLAISKQLVELMDGQIGVNSSPGQGSTFWFEIPLEVAADQTAPTGRVRDPRVLAGRSVLFVDDHLASRELVNYQLGYWGMNVETAGTGAEGIEKLLARKNTGGHFDFVLLDMQMPDISGLALARKIKMDDLAGSAHCLLLSFMGHHFDAEVLQGAGIALSLFKPLKQARLLECLVGLATGQEDLLHPATPGVALDTRTQNRSARILVAEDNPVNQKVVLRQLAKLGFQADAVASGIEAIAALERIPYDVVLLDCNMPEMDGYEAAREIKRRVNDASIKPHLRSAPYLIAITANVLEGDRERCLAAGMDDYVQKPVELAELVAALGRAGVNLKGGAPHPTPASPMVSADAARLEEPSTLVLDQSVLNRLRQLRQPGQPDPVAELIDLFLQDMPKRIQQMQEAFNKQDANSLRIAAHTLKGSAKNMGARRLAQTCADLEAQSRQGQIANAPALIATIQSQAVELAQALAMEKTR